MNAVKKSTHWSVSEDAEAWTEEPASTPEQAVSDWLRDSEDDDAGGLMYGIADSPQTVTVHGFIKTNDPLEGDDQFDGYEAGQDYYKQTCETVKVEVSLAFKVLPVTNGGEP